MRIIFIVKRKNREYLATRNNIDVAPQALLMAAGVILSVVIISIMVGQLRAADEMANVVENNISDQVDAIRNGSIMQYDGLIVNGADIVNFYKRNFDDYPIGTTAPFVIEIDHSNDGKSNGYEYTNSAFSGDMRDSTSQHYIKPSSQWKCNVVKNKNGIIVRVRFVKQ